MLLTIFNSIPGAIAQGLIWGLMAIGVYITYKILDVADLTVDGSICTGACVCAVLVTSGTNVWVAMFVAFLVGMLCGLMTGFFHTFMGIPAILAGILTQLMLWSVNLKILGQANMVLSSRSYKTIVSLLNIPASIGILFAFIFAIIGLLYWFFGTEYGSGVRATGCNPRMAKAQGINVNLNKVVGLMLSNGLVALSGALLAQYQGFADINMGKGAIVIGLAAVIIGLAAVSWIPKIGKNFATQLSGVVLGGIIYFIVYTIVICLGFDTDLLKMLSAIVVGIFLGAPYLKKKYSLKRILKKFGFVKKDVIIAEDSKTDVEVLEGSLVVDENMGAKMDAFNEKPIDDAAHRVEKNKSSHGGEV